MKQDLSAAAREFGNGGRRIAEVKEQASRHGKKAILEEAHQVSGVRLQAAARSENKLWLHWAHLNYFFELGTLLDTT